MTRHRSTLAAYLLAVGLATGAAAQQVEITVDRAVDFSQYKTFSIRVATPWGNEIGERNVLEGFADAFAAKGWTRVPESEADVQILLHGASEENKRLDTFYTGYGGWRWSGMGSSHTTVTEYTVGTLVVDIFDSGSQQLVWRGIAQDELKRKQAKREEQAERAIAKLLKDFPPTSNGG